MRSLKAFITLTVAVGLISCGSETGTPSPVAPTPVPVTDSYNVAGTVRDQAGNPVEGASVFVGWLFSKTGPRVVATTNAAGRFAGTLPAGSYDYRASRPGFEDLSGRGVVVAADTTLDLNLRPGIILSGNVIEAGVGRLDGAKVEVIDGPNAGRSMLTGGPGSMSYSFVYLLPGEFTVRVSKEGYEPVEQRVSAAVNTNADFSMKWAYGSCLRSVTPVVFPAFASSGGDGVATVEVQDGRSWTAVADNPWIEITAPSARTGTGTVAFKILPQPAGATATRKGAVMVRCGTSAGQNIWVEQTPDCQVRLQRTGETPETFTAAGGVGMLRAEVGVPNCIWTFSSMSDWIHTAGISSWPGNPPADLAFVVRPNTTGASRTGQLKVGETLWQVTQHP